MKGVVFSEFIEMVEDKFSPEIADRLIEESDLESEGAYTAVGTYDHAEMLTMVVKLSEITELPVPVLVKTFGEHLLVRFTQLYPGFFEGVDTAFEFLETIEDHVHVEVRKLYPDAELPTFATERPAEGQLKLIYISKRPFAILAEGLIVGSISYFNENINVEMVDLSSDGGTHAEFLLTKKD